MTNAYIPVRPTLPDVLLDDLYHVLQLAGQAAAGGDRAAVVSERLADCVLDTLDDRRFRGVLLLLRDLFAQGWGVTLVDSTPFLHHPEGPQEDVGEGGDKEWYRAALLQERSKQLQQDSVVRFIRKMEKNRRNGIQQLVGDPGRLLQAIERSGASVVRPYLQVIQSDRERDEYTGLRLLDVWRYFRLTWSLPYKPTPGRNLYFLVRDAGQENHPVMGIAALGNSIVQITCRDDELGWTMGRLVERIQSADFPSASAIMGALCGAVRRTLEGITLEDLLPEGHQAGGISEELLRNAIQTEVTEPPVRVTADASAEAWWELSQTPLYRRKRAKALLGLLRADSQFRSVGHLPPDVALRQLASTGAGRSALSTALQANKKEKIGTSMMDIIVCGAVPPYNHLLAGKLVTLLMMSPEVSTAYEQRYRDQVSVISSGMKGQPVVRDSRLVFLGTTSLYETGSSQYNRVSLPEGCLGPGYPRAKIGYRVLGLTKGFGTVYVSDEAAAALADLIFEIKGSRLFYNTYGEGTSPRLRLVRAGLELLGLPADDLLRHNFKRIVYGVHLAENTREFLMGEEDRPRYYLNQDNPREATEAICRYWRERWLSMRVKNNDVLTRLGSFSAESFLLGGSFRVNEGGQEN